MEVSEGHRDGLRRKHSISFSDAEFHLRGLRRALVERPSDWFSVRFGSLLEAEATRAVFAGVRLYSLTCEDALGVRVIAYFNESPALDAVGGFLKRTLGQTPFEHQQSWVSLPLFGGGRLVTPTGAGITLDRVAVNTLAPLARRLAQKQDVQ
jgi:hypothetical protein